MTVLLDAIELIAEDVAAHVGNLKTEPTDEDAGDSVDSWLYNGSLFVDLLDLAELANRAAAIVDRPRVREYLASVDFPRSQRLAGLLAAPVAAHASASTPASTPSPAATPSVSPVVRTALRLAGMKPVPSSETAIRVLATAADPAQISAAWLADKVGIQQRNARRLIYQLEQRNLVRAVRPPIPSRGVPALYAITDQFQAVLAPIAQGAAQ